MKSVEIADRRIGSGHPPYVIAEISGNHNGKLDRALALIEAAQSAGAHAIKLQTYTADTLTIDCAGEDFKIKSGLWEGRTLYELYQEAHTPWDWHPALFERARELGIAMFSTPFDKTAVDFLEDLNCPAYKIASFELVDHALIERVAGTGKPMILSTGMANLEEITEAVETIREAGGNDFILLHCISGYPTPADQANLRTIPDLEVRFGCPIGLSDHTMGTAVAVAAVAQGAVAIEKHVTLRRADGGPDAAFSLEPEELAQLVLDVATAHASLGQVNYERTSAEQSNAVFRRSLYIVEDVPKDGELTVRNVRAIRPGFGLAPKYLSAVLGKRAATDLSAGTALDWSRIAESTEE